MKLTSDEQNKISDLGFEVSQLMQQIDALEIKKKAISTELSDEIKKLQAIVSEKCEVMDLLSTYWVLDKPSAGKKSKFRKSTNELITVKEMTSDDYPDLFAADSDEEEDEPEQTVDTMTLYELNAAENEQLLLPEATEGEEEL